MRPVRGQSCSLWPTGQGVRVDAGFHSGNVISPFYDSMLAKVVVWGRDRAQATQRMEAALRNTWVVGPPTNIPLLKDTMHISLEARRLGNRLPRLENLPQPAPLNLERGAVAVSSLVASTRTCTLVSRDTCRMACGRTVVAIRYVAKLEKKRVYAGRRTLKV